MIDPIAFSLGGVKVRWYGIAYALGLIFAWQMGMYIAKNNSDSGNQITEKHIDQFLIYALLGVVIGGRLGQVLFYYPEYYLLNPVDIFKIWQGGMAFHGGLIGVLVAAYILCRRSNIPFLHLTDYLAVLAPFGIMLGRIANFINGEHVGRITHFTYAVVFPNISEDPRHASQLYQALLEGALPMFILFVLLKKGYLRQTGFLSGAFLCVYGIGRMIGEIFREPEIIIGFFPNIFTYGMLLSLPMLLVGLWLIYKAKS